MPKPEKIIPTNGLYPRPLRIKEKEMLESVLPSDRAGYLEYRQLIDKMVVLGEGRRGKGNLILGFEGDKPDITSPLAPVIAFGILETDRGEFSITVRQYIGRQIDVEIVSQREEELPDSFDEKRRWTFSSWMPGLPSPRSGEHLREVIITNNLTLAISPTDRRLWLYDHRTGMNHLIPITSFYGELMVRRKDRDIKVVPQPDRFFTDLDKFADEEMRLAFLSYNKLHPKVSVDVSEVDRPDPKLGRFLRSLFGRKAHDASS